MYIIYIIINITSFSYLSPYCHDLFSQFFGELITVLNTNLPIIPHIWDELIIIRIMFKQYLYILSIVVSFYLNLFFFVLLKHTSMLIIMLLKVGYYNWMPDISYVNRIIFQLIDLCECILFNLVYGLLSKKLLKDYLRTSITLAVIILLKIPVLIIFAHFLLLSFLKNLDFTKLLENRLKLVLGKKLVIYTNKIILNSRLKKWIWESTKSSKLKRSSSVSNFKKPIKSNLFKLKNNQTFNYSFEEDYRSHEKNFGRTNMFGKTPRLYEESKQEESFNDVRNKALKSSTKTIKNYDFLEKEQFFKSDELFLGKMTRNWEDFSKIKKRSASSDFENLHNTQENFSQFSGCKPNIECLRPSQKGSFDNFTNEINFFSDKNARFNTIARHPHRSSNGVQEQATSNINFQGNKIGFSCTAESKEGDYVALGKTGKPGILMSRFATHEDDSNLYKESPELSVIMKFHILDYIKSKDDFIKDNESKFYGENFENLDAIHQTTSISGHTKEALDFDLESLPHTLAALKSHIQNFEKVSSLALKLKYQGVVFSSLCMCGRLKFKGLVEFRHLKEASSLSKDLKISMEKALVEDFTIYTEFTNTSERADMGLSLSDVKPKEVFKEEVKKISKFMRHTNNEQEESLAEFKLKFTEVFSFKTGLDENVPAFFSDEVLTFVEGFTFF